MEWPPLGSDYSVEPTGQSPRRLLPEYASRCLAPGAGGDSLGDSDATVAYGAQPGGDSGRCLGDGPLDARFRGGLRPFGSGSGPGRRQRRRGVFQPEDVPEPVVRRGRRHAAGPQYDHAPGRRRPQPGRHAALFGQRLSLHGHEPECRRRVGESVGAFLPSRRSGRRAGHAHRRVHVQPDRVHGRRRGHHQDEHQVRSSELGDLGRHRVRQQRRHDRRDGRAARQPGPGHLLAPGTSAPAPTSTSSRRRPVRSPRTTRSARSPISAGRRQRISAGRS